MSIYKSCFKDVIASRKKGGHHIVSKQKMEIKLKVLVGKCNLAKKWVGEEEIVKLWNSHISIKLQADSNILVSPEAGWGNCLPYVLAPPSLSCESGG